MAMTTIPFTHGLLRDPLSLPLAITQDLDHHMTDMNAHGAGAHSCMQVSKAVIEEEGNKAARPAWILGDLTARLENSKKALTQHEHLVKCYAVWMNPPDQEPDEEATERWTNEYNRQKENVETFKAEIAAIERLKFTCRQMDTVTTALRKKFAEHNHVSFINAYYTSFYYAFVEFLASADWNCLIKPLIYDFNLMGSFAEYFRINMNHVRAVFIAADDEDGDHGVIVNPEFSPDKERTEDLLSQVAEQVDETPEPAEFSQLTPPESPKTPRNNGNNSNKRQRKGTANERALGIR